MNENHNEIKKNTTGPNGNGVKAMWGLSLPTLESIYWAAIWITAIAGAIGITGALLSTIVGYRIAEVVQRQSDERIAVAEEKMRESDERIAVAEQRVAEANANAAKANEKAEHERLKRMEIEQKLAPRSLSKKQVERLSNRIRYLKSLFSEISVAMVVLTDNNPDADPLAEQLVSVFESIGWHVSISRARGERRIGVVITVSKGSNQETYLAANTISEEFNSAGIITERGPFSLVQNDKPNVIRIVIGIKPETW